MHALEPRLVASSTMTMFRDLIYNCLAADAWYRRFVRRINIRDYNPVSVVKCAAEYVMQPVGSRIAMRLKLRQHALASHHARRVQRLTNVRRMVRVIIDSQKPLPAIHHFAPLR